MAVITPASSKEPQLAQVDPTRASEGPLSRPMTVTSRLTETTQITVSMQPTTTDARSTMLSLPPTTPLTLSTVISPVVDLTAQLGMTVTGRITDTVPVTALNAAPHVITDSGVISDALTSPLPAPSKVVVLPTPTPNAILDSPSAVPPAPTPDGIVRTARVPILMYHYLSEPPANADIYRTDLSVTPERFAAHLDAMQAAGFNTISLYALLDHLVQGTQLSDNPVVITFDDGYRDNYENAFPLLRDRGMTASFFVVTDFTNEERPIYMTWDMLREMAEGGMDIESHARNHVSLAGKDIDYLVWQALGSMEAIEQEIGVRPRFVSYPAGEYDQQTIDLFHSANYWAGLTTVQGATHQSDDLFQLHRVRVRGTTTPEELLRLLELDW